MEVKKYNEITDEFLVDYFKSITKKNTSRLTDFGCFDIETSKIHFESVNLDAAVIYSWQFQLGETTILGRDSEEYWHFIERIKPLIGEDHQYNIYVHNLGYELKFLLGIFPESNFTYFPNKIERAMYAQDGNIKYVCSRWLSGRSLEAFTKGCEHEKAVEVGYDYELIRTPSTELTEDETKYCVHDVLGLREAILRLMDIKQCSIYDLERILTNQKFTRRLIKKALSDSGETVNKPTFGYHKLLEYANHGAIVWAVENYRSAYFEDEKQNKVLKNVHNYDANKFYTSIQLGDKFPIGKWYGKTNFSEDEADKLWLKTAWVAVAVFSGIRLKDENTPVPHIVKSKADALGAEWIQDTRLKLATKLKIAVTDVDFKVIKEQYDWFACSFSYVAISDYGDLPDWYKNALHKQYLLVKTLDKNTEEYVVEKSCLNGFYGSCVRNKNNAYVDDSGNIVELTEKEFLDATKFDPVSYAWGVWTAAWGRYHIQEVIKECPDKVVYIGSDSIKTLGPVDLSGYNKKICDVLRPYNTKEDIMDPKFTGLGCFELEYVAKNFKQLKQVTYCCEFKDSIDKLAENKICEAISEADRQWAIDTLGFTEEDFKKFNVLVTVSGISKMRASMQLFKDGGIKSFKKGYNFNKVPRIVRKSVDIPCCKLEHNGEVMPVHSGWILDNEYNFELGKESEIMMNPDEIIEALKEKILNDRYSKKFF